MKLLFVDHIFHKKTRSSEFLKEFLKEFFELEEVFIDTESPGKDVQKARASQADVVLLWQMDFLAPIFLASGLRTVVAPMYDGSANMPDLHWIWARQARFINFSRRLHDRVRRVGGDSMLVKYFSAPPIDGELPNFDEFRVFLWQRRPEEGMNVTLVEKLLGQQMASLHVHDTPDDPELPTAAFLKQGLPTYRLTTSRWFENADDYLKLLAQANVFITPRRSEGIGMAMIEAMGRGMVVFSTDYPVHDEYISNWTNGVLFNVDSPGQVQLDRTVAESMSRMARNTVATGYKKWRDGLPRLLDYIRSTPKPNVHLNADIDSLAEGLCRAFLAGGEAYATYLYSHMEFLAGLAGKGVLERLGKKGEFLLEQPREQQSSHVRPGSLPWLSQNRLKVAEMLSGRFVISGRIHGHAGIAWVARHGITLGFRLDPRLGATDVLQLEYCLPRDLQGTPKLCVSLNGWTLWNDTLTETEGRLVIPVLPQARAAENSLVLQANEVAFGYGGIEPVSLGIREIAFT